MYQSNLKQHLLQTDHLQKNSRMLKERKYREMHSRKKGQRNCFYHDEISQNCHYERQDMILHSALHLHCSESENIKSLNNFDHSLRFM